MVIPTIGAVILVPFPFSDLSQAKNRPAIVVAQGNRGDWILCQITSVAYGDAQAIELLKNDFVSGGLLVQSFARPSKLFTAHQSLFIRQVGALDTTALDTILNAIIAVLRPPTTP